jgi:hypothetical protein
MAFNATYPGSCMKPIQILDHVSRQEFCLMAYAPGLPTDGWTVRLGPNGTFNLNRENFINSPMLLFNMAKDGQLATSAGHVVVLANTTQKDAVPQIWDPTNPAPGDAPKLLRCKPAPRERLDCRVGVDVEGEMVFYYTRFSLLRQLDTSLTFSTPLEDFAGNQNPVHSIELMITTGANCFNLPPEIQRLPTITDYRNMENDEVHPVHPEGP